MNKVLLKCIVSIICFICGLLLNLFSFLDISKTSPLFMTSILLGSLLTLIGIIAYSIYYNQLKIIYSLKNNQISILAHWFYLPKHFQVLKHYLEETKRTHLSIVILLGLLSLLLASGIALSFPVSGILPSIIICFVVSIVCITSYLIICLYYRSKLNKNIEIIIGTDAIYFLGNIYTCQRATCFLTDVKLCEGYEPYLQFLYSSPGVSYGPIHILTIPVPLNQLNVAKHICLHYLENTHL